MSVWEWRWNEIEKSLGDGKDQKFRLLFIGTRPKDGFPMCSDVSDESSETFLVIKAYHLESHKVGNICCRISESGMHT